MLLGGLGLLAFACCLTHSYAVSQCDQNIINNIKNFWIGTGIPKDILKTLEASGQLGLTHSTQNYALKNLQTNNAKCIFGKFDYSKGTHKATITVRPQSGKDQIASFGEKESGGVLYEEGNDIERYVIFTKNGVTPFYICSRKSGNKNGVPAGGLAVAVSKYNDPETRSTIDVTVGLMRNLGIKLNKSYNKSCFKK